MKLADILLMYEYDDWADQRILDAAARVTADEFVAPGSFPWGGLRGTLVHTLEAHYDWRSFFETGSFPAGELKEADFPRFEDVQERYQQEREAMQAYLARLDDAAVEGIVSYVNEAGIRREGVLWHFLYHVVNHGTQHRSEAAALVTSYGQSPGNLDFTRFLAERAKRPA